MYFHDIPSPKVAEIQVRKSGFLQIIKKTYSIPWQALFRDAILAELYDFKHDKRKHWDCPRAPFSPSGLQRAPVRSPAH